MRKPVYNHMKLSKKNMEKESKNILGDNCEIAKKLKEYYTFIEQEELPPIFIELLERIDRAEKEAKEK